MIFKDIAEYEDKDSELAKFTISQLHSKIDYLQDKISKAIEYIENCSGIYSNALGEEKEMITSQNVLDILKGVDKK